MGRLDQLDLTQSLTRKEQDKRLGAAYPRLLQLRLTLGGQLGGRIGPGLLVIFEGWDAAGKGGCIKHLVNPLDPRHVRVAQFSAPTPDEKRHHFLFRFIPKLPGLGGMAVLDRSWYGRVLVERVEGYATEEQWRRAFREITDFERSIALEGTIIVKFWLHISPEEQLLRFRRRESDPLKRWKLTSEDWRNRGRLDDYLIAAEGMLERTDHEHARWHVIEGESKRFARVKVVEATIAAIEEGLRARGYDPPVPVTMPAAADI